LHPNLVNYKRNTMSAVALQGLLDYLMGTLSKSNRVWLAEHLVMPEKVVETPNQKYVRESLTRAMNEVKEAMATGKQLQTADDFLLELEKEAV